MKPMTNRFKFGKTCFKVGAALSAALLLVACNTTGQTAAPAVAAKVDAVPAITAEKFEADRKAILRWRATIR